MTNLHLDRLTKEELIAQIPKMVEVSDLYTFDHDTLIGFRHISILTDYGFTEELLQSVLTLTKVEYHSVLSGEQELSSQQKEHITSLISMLKKAESVFTSIDLFWNWMHTSEFRFGGRTLMDCLKPSAFVSVIYTRLIARLDMIKYGC